MTVRDIAPPRRTRTLALLGGLALAASLAACQPEDDESLDSVHRALAACVAPALQTGNVCGAGGGQLIFQVTLPGDQQYVEVFARQNGVQNVATAIHASGVGNGDGTTTYSFSRSGYAASDRVEYRFYSYRPGAPCVFTPGTAEATWYGHIGAVPVSKDAAVIASSYGTGPVPNRNFGGAATVDIGEYHLTSEGLFGYALAGRVPSGATVQRAELVIPAADSPGGSTVTLRLNQVSAPWSESTVTWNNKPAYGFVGEVAVHEGVENHLDVTGQVAAALASGEVSFALQPSQASSSVDNVFIDAKEKPGGAPTSLSVHWID